MHEAAAMIDATDKPAKRRVSPLQQAIGLTLSLALIWAIFGRDHEGQTPASAPATAAVVPAPRVASLSPAITDSLAELGLAAHVVGRSGFCRSVPATVPVVGDLRSFDAERLALAKPDVLFVQPPIAGVDPALRELCTQKSIELVERRLDTLDDMRGLTVDITRVFGAEAAEKLAPIAAFLAEPAPQTASDAQRVVIVVSVDPILAVGRGNYLDELLARAGAANAVDAKGWVELSVESLVALKPARVIGISETRARALEVANFLEVLPWNGAAPAVVADALPELLTPSLRAIARRGEVTRLLSAASSDAGSSASTGAAR
jgi:ABC-type hemin transport system substrate-binding protein